MDRKQADAVVRAMLSPDFEAREELRDKRQKQATALVMQRRAAGAALIGMGLGAAIGYFAFADTSLGLIVGGIGAYLLTRLVQGRTA